MLQAELHAALIWARWMEWFHFAQRKAGLRKMECLAQGDGGQTSS